MGNRTITFICRMNSNAIDSADFSGDKLTVDRSITRTSGRVVVASV